MKAFADKHGIPVPQPHNRDVLLSNIRNNYDTAAKKTNNVAHYPGNWLYESWSESDLKDWLDTHGVPAPQPTTRDKLIASVRRNSRLATLKAQKVQKAQGTASASAQSAAASISDAILDSWDDSQIKAWADKNGVKVPHGSKRAELLAIARKHRAQLTGDTASQSGANVASSASASAASAYGAATTKAGNAWARSTDEAQHKAGKAQQAFDAAVGLWSETRLKAYLDSRGVPVPQNSKKDELLAAVRKHSHKASTGYSAWTYDDWTAENLKNWLLKSGDKNAKVVAEKSSATRDELLKAAQDNYASASATGGNAFASVTSYLAKQTHAAKANTFDTWSDSDLKAYLDSYGVPVPQGSKTDELKAYARKQATYFRHGTTTPQGTLWAKLRENLNWAYNQVVSGAQKGAEVAQQEGNKGAHRAQEAAQYAKDRAYEEKEKAKHRADEL